MMSRDSQRWLVAVAMMIVVAGCQRGPTPIEGGTRGVLRAAGTPLREVRLAFYSQEHPERGEVGFAVSGAEGEFALLLPNAVGPLHLAPGVYRVTLESVGAEPLRFPAAVSEAKRTPLIVQATAETTLLVIDAPAPNIGR